MRAAQRCLTGGESARRSDEASGFLRLFCFFHLDRFAIEQFGHVAEDHRLAAVEGMPLTRLEFVDDFDPGAVLNARFDGRADRLALVIEIANRLIA